MMLLVMEADYDDFLPLISTIFHSSPSGPSFIVVFVLVVVVLLLQGLRNSARGTVIQLFQGLQGGYEAVQKSEETV